MSDIHIKPLRDQIEQICRRHEVYLVDVVLRGRRGSQVLSIYIDTEDGISLDQISTVTRDVNDLLEVQDVLTGAYRLEVSSPGVDRNLQFDWEFRKNLGRQLRVSFEIDSEPSEATGKLLSVGDDAILLKDRKAEVSIPLAAIRKACVQLKW